MKLLVSIVVAISLVCGYSIFKETKPTSELALLESNIEALSNDEPNLKVYCKGNTGTCAKGKDENTGKEIVIHGKLTLK